MNPIEGAKGSVETQMECTIWSKPIEIPSQTPLLPQRALHSIQLSSHTPKQQTITACNLIRMFFGLENAQIQPCQGRILVLQSGGR